MIAKELVETALKNAGVKRLSHVLHGQSVNRGATEVQEVER